MSDTQKAWRMPVEFYRIAVVTPGGFTETESISPRAAAKRDPAKFLEFAVAVATAVTEIAQQVQSELKFDAKNHNL